MNQHNPDPAHADDTQPTQPIPDTPPDTVPGQVTDHLSGWGGESFAGSESDPDQAAPSQPAFEDLTLGQALGYLMLHPVETGRRLWRVLAETPDDGADRPAAPPDAEPAADTVPVRVPESVPDSVPERATRAADTVVTADDERAGPGSWRARWGHVVTLALAVLLALRGGWVLHSATIDPAMHYTKDTGSAGFWLVLAGAVFGAYALYAGRDWWARRVTGPAARLRAVAGDDTGVWRGGFVLLALILTLLAAVGTGGMVGAGVLLALAAALWIAAQVLGLPVAAMAGAADTVPVAVPERESGAELRAGWRDRLAVSAWLGANAHRIALIPFAAAFALIAYTENVHRAANGSVTDVVLTTGGALAWLFSVALWIVALGVDVRTLPERARAALRSDRDWGETLANAVRRVDAPLIALLAIMVFGLWFRALDLEQTPPEMTSDHIEKLIDALKVHEGYYAVFFPNNGGREAFQMYVVAFVADELGVGFNFNALKWATIIEGVLTLPVVFWMAQQVIGAETTRQRQLGRWAGVALAGLLAVSSWHLMLSRLGLRIVLTPLTTALVIGFLARAMRHNRTRDFLALGLVLGAGTYFYQANRMLPLLAVMGVALAILHTVRRWRDLPGLVLQMGALALIAALPVGLLVLLGGEGAADLLPVVAGAWFAVVALWLRADPESAQDPAVRPQAWRYAGGLLVAGVVALALYLPMYHYSRLYPDQFWNRTRGRLFGENAFVRVNDQGLAQSYEPSLSEQAERFWEQRDVFLDNYADALRMYHWEGDAAWINNAYSYPALDGIAGGLLVLGLVVWGVWALRRRDVALWLLPVVVVIMLLPSALTLAYTIENPSFTRASGTIPAIFMLAALPLGALLWRVSRLPGRVFGVGVGPVIALAILASVIGGALDWNRKNFHTYYHLSYSNSWKPYREIARPLRTFAEGEGSYGNAFMVAYPHWLDHRILGAMAGDIRWPNGLVTREELLPMIERNRGTRYAYAPEKPLFVMYHAADLETGRYLRALFPRGETREYEYTWAVGVDQTRSDSFMIYTVHAGEIVPD